ncbi:Fur-regulated basic protein B [Terribacillus halophilus]|uniref:Fur-regulated basic protein B n=1 Tax=Terribacillus halophilus TaxID=361279 RepID=A0A1G6NM76_9BACI|nr:FbpB family small basic protein [Terribacillus halophilus]SDC69092.1 Fur-regulated basic protein B [Terribacillus halophilus]
MRPRKLSLEELITQNKNELLQDDQAMLRIEESLDDKYGIQSDQLE